MTTKKTPKRKPKAAPFNAAAAFARAVALLRRENPTHARRLLEAEALWNAEHDAVVSERDALRQRVAELDADHKAAVHSAQFLQGEVDRLRECSTRAQRGLDATTKWYAERWERLRRELVPGSLDEQRACDIMANGRLLIDSDPASATALAVQRAEKAEAEVLQLRPRAGDTMAMAAQLAEMQAERDRARADLGRVNIEHQKASGDRDAYKAELSAHIVERTALVAEGLVHCGERTADAVRRLEATRVHLRSKLGDETARANVNEQERARASLQASDREALREQLAQAQANTARVAGEKMTAGEQVATLLDKLCVPGSVPGEDGKLSTLPVDRVRYLSTWPAFRNRPRGDDVPDALQVAQLEIEFLQRVREAQRLTIRRAVQIEGILRGGLLWFRDKLQHTTAADKARECLKAAADAKGRA